MKINKEILWTAWRMIEKKNSSGGIDDIEIIDFKQNANKNIIQILEKLNNHSYVPQPYLQIKIPKNNTETRTLGLATIMDKIVQQAILNHLEPQIEPSFFENSYAYRTDKGPQKALKQVRHLIQNKKLEWLAKCDIDNFFDTIPHQRLRNLLKPFLKSEFYTELLFMFCKMGYVMPNFKWQDRTKGVPQGALLSPLLSNLYLSGLDQKMNQLDIGYIRYADDFIILAKSEEIAKATLNETISYLKEKLLLQLNEGTYVKNVQQGFKYLGIWVTTEGFSIHQEKTDKLKAKIENAINSAKFETKYNETIQGIKNYYGRLIPQHFLFPIDEYQKQLFKQKIEKIKAIRTKSGIETQLFNLQFITPHFEQNADFHKKEIVSQVFEKIKSKKILSAEQGVKKRKKEYELKATENHEIIVTGFGKSIGISKSTLTIKENAKVLQTFPLSTVEHIAIQSNACNISAKLIEYCADNKIPIDFLDFNGQPYAKIFSPLNDTYQLWYLQFEHLQKPASIAIAKDLVMSKINNQTKLLKYYAKYAKYHEKDLPEALQKALIKMDLQKQKLKELNEPNLEKIRPQLLSCEAQASIHYWDIVRIMIDEETTFSRRVGQGAKDIVNSMLNYGYSILYRHVWSSLLRQGLNPTFSYIHTPQKFEGTLVFDFIETFRQPIVDRAIISMINKKTKLGLKDGKLDDDTKKKLIIAVNDRLRRYDTYMGERRTLFNIIKQQAIQYSQYLKGYNPKFKPYQMSKW